MSIWNNRNLGLLSFQINRAKLETDLLRMAKEMVVIGPPALLLLFILCSFSLSLIPSQGSTLCQGEMYFFRHSLW
jgi:hypothetical protein